MPRCTEVCCRGRYACTHVTPPRARLELSARSARARSPVPLAGWVALWPPSCSPHVTTPSLTRCCLSQGSLAPVPSPRKAPSARPMLKSVAAARRQAPMAHRCPSVSAAASAPGPTADTAVPARTGQRRPPPQRRQSHALALSACGRVGAPRRARGSDFLPPSGRRGWASLLSEDEVRSAVSAGSLEGRPRSRCRPAPRRSRSWGADSSRWRDGRMGTPRAPAAAAARACTSSVPRRPRPRPRLRWPRTN